MPTSQFRPHRLHRLICPPLLLLLLSGHKLAALQSLISARRMTKETWLLTSRLFTSAKVLARQTFATPRVMNLARVNHGVMLGTYWEVAQERVSVASNVILRSLSFSAISDQISLCSFFLVAPTIAVTMERWEGIGCPEEYISEEPYSEGSTVSLNGVVYQCKPHVSRHPGHCSSLLHRLIYQCL